MYINASFKIQVALSENQKGLLDRKFELDFDIDVDSEREELEMPELSKGKYLHDFKVRDTSKIWTQITTHKYFAMSNKLFLITVY